MSVGGINYVVKFYQVTSIYFYQFFSSHFSFIYMEPNHSKISAEHTKVKTWQNDIEKPN